MFDFLGSIIEVYQQPYRMECTLIADNVSTGNKEKHREEAGLIGDKHNAYFNIYHHSAKVGRFWFINNEVAKRGDTIIIREDGFGEITWNSKTNILTAAHYDTCIDRKMIYSCIKK